jgi:hypothetical protein
LGGGGGVEARAKDDDDGDDGKNRWLAPVMSYIADSFSARVRLRQFHHHRVEMM